MPENSNKHIEYDFLIVGAGLAGATFARLATDRGKKCLIIDKRNHIGGNIYTKNTDGIHVHKYGPHIFHTSNTKIWKFISQFADFNRFTYSPIIKSKGWVLNLPFNMNTFQKLWNVVTPAEAMNKISIECAPYKNLKISNLEEQALSLVGREIYEIIIKEYTQKQWGKLPAELPEFIIKRLPLRFTYDNNYFNDFYQGIPIGGYTVLINKMLKGIPVILKTDYINNRNELSVKARQIIYTGCIDRYFNYRYGKLEYRSLHFEESQLDIHNYQGNAVVNYGDIDISYTRIIEHKHFELGNQESTIITKEYPVNFAGNNEPFYPINNSHNNNLYNKYKQLANKEKNTFFIGRLAEYQYYDMDQIINNSMELFSKIIENR